jgi:DTW domain-containing protein YfiP
MPEKRVSIANDLKDFLKEHIVPLKKGEVIKGSPVKYCIDCGHRKYSCRCYAEELRNAKRRMLPQSKSSI